VKTVVVAPLRIGEALRYFYYRNRSHVKENCGVTRSGAENGESRATVSNVCSIVSAYAQRNGA
jgi:hypothetical protein